MPGRLGDYWARPQAVTGEYVDDLLVTERPLGGVLKPYTLGWVDGKRISSPWVNSFYEITRYRINTPGLHLVQWRTGTFVSNVLCLRVGAPS